MHIESLSIKTSTIAIFSMLGVIAVVLSVFAGSYFKQAAMDAQIDSLSRVIKVASEEMLKQVGSRTFDLGMKLGYSNELVSTIRDSEQPVDEQLLAGLLDDPFISGFVGFSEIDLEKIRIFDLQLELLGESSMGPANLGNELTTYISNKVMKRNASERLKAIDALWMSAQGPLFSTLVPLGGLRPVGYLEIIANPVFNLPGIGKITKTPVRIYSMSGEQLNSNNQTITDGYLPVEFILQASDGTPAFKIAGYENIEDLSVEMDQTQNITISGFLVLAFSALLFALWLFNRFMFSPLSRMINDMQQITHGKLELTVNNRGLREFHILADAFNSMTEQVRMRTNDLQRLLDLDDSALMCFDHDKEAVYFNTGATSLFGYASDEIIDLESEDLFTDDLPQLLTQATRSNNSQQDNFRTQLNCKHQDGHQFLSDASISCVDVMGKSGFAIALKSKATVGHSDFSQNDQHLDAMEKTLGRLLDFARDNPGSLSGLGQLGLSSVNNGESDIHKSQLREQVVKVMNLALTCWEHKLGKSKIDLAEESKIWPVYIDKSTPTTRTLDRYLNINTCPKNPRSQRAVDTAEFVIRHMNNTTQEINCQELYTGLDSLRLLIAGINTSDK